MDAAWYEKELERRDRKIAELEEALRRRDQKLAKLEQELADLKAALQRRSEANASKSRVSRGISASERRSEKGENSARSDLLDAVRRKPSCLTYPAAKRSIQSALDRRNVPSRMIGWLGDWKTVVPCLSVTRSISRIGDFPPKCPICCRVLEYGIEVAVILSYLVYTVGVSINKARALLLFFCQLQLSRSQANSLLDQLARLWESEFETLLELMSLALVVYIDETGWKVSKKNCYAWVFTTLSHTVLLYGRTRDASILDEVLPRDRFQGIGVSDDYAAYRDRFSRSQKCWSHLLRKAIALMLAHPAKHHYRRFFERLLDLYREAKRYQQDRRLGAAAREIRVIGLEEKLGSLHAFGRCVVKRRRGRRARLRQSAARS